MTASREDPEGFHCDSHVIDLRAEMQQMRRELREDIAALRRQAAAGFDHLIAEIRLLDGKLDILLGRRQR